MKFSSSSHSLILFRNMCNEREQIQCAMHVQTTLFMKSQAWKRHGSKMPVAQLQRTPPLFIILLEIWEQFCTHNYLWSVLFSSVYRIWISKFRKHKKTRVFWGYSLGQFRKERCDVTQQTRGRYENNILPTEHRRCVDQSTCFVGRVDQKYRTKKYRSVL